MFSQSIAQLRSAYYQTRSYCKPFFADFDLNAGFLGKWDNIHTGLLRFVGVMAFYALPSSRYTLPT